MVMKKTPIERKGKIMEGVVLSVKNAKTVIVAVENTWRHPLYKKTLRSHRHFAAHNEMEGIAEGTRVRMQEVPPMSKTKHFIIVEKI